MNDGTTGGGSLAVGLVIGGGTGPEIATVFQRALKHLSRAHQVGVDIVVCPHRFGTFFSAGGSESALEIHRGRERDCTLYQEFVSKLAGRRVPALFHTAIDAQTLYLARQRLGAVKVENLDMPDSRILLVRDCGQGFYTGDNDTSSPDVIQRTCEFRRDWTERLIDHALDIGATHFGGIDRIDHVLAAYKFHLLDRRFADWVFAHGRLRGVDIGLFQPDTMNRNLLRGNYPGNVLLIGANEWVDVLHVDVLTNRYGVGAHETRAAYSTYLAGDGLGLTAYQTVHGSADDIAGQGIVNPLATLRAAALVMGRHGQCASVHERMEDAIGRVHADGIRTPDQGGEHGTEAVTGAVLRAYEQWDDSRRREGPPSETHQALMVVDMQNDMCAPGGCFDRLGLIDTSRMAALADRLQTLLDGARAAGVEVLHTRIVADPEALPANMVERFRRFGRDGCLREGSWGAAVYGPEPAAGEPVIVKGGYDPFLDTDLRERLERARIDHLVLAGVFTDVCIDATARTAYQLGMTPVVLGDATLALERGIEESLSFMERYYGARVASIEQWLGEIAPAKAVASMD